MSAASLAIDGLTVAGRGRPRLADVRLHLDPATLTVVLGPNGAGKSTLLRALAGLVAVQAGTLHHGAVDLRRATPRARAATVAWLPQHPRPEEGLTAAEVVAAARFRFDEPAAASHDAALQALRTVGAEAFAARILTTLSGGEAQRVRLASLVAQEASWWLLDEPVNHLDPAVRLALVTQLRHAVERGRGVLLVTHDLGLLGHLGGARLVVLDGGAVVWDGPVDDPQLDTILGPIFGLDLRRVAVDSAWHLVATGRAS